MRRFALPALLLVCCAALLLQGCALSGPRVKKPSFPSVSFDVMKFGATGKGKVNDTPAINKAIEACNAAGGGSVIFPAGTYIAASIHLKSNVCFKMDKNAIIMGAPAEMKAFDEAEPNKFPYQDAGHSHFHNAIMWGEDIENFAILGGTINGGSISSKVGPGLGDKQISLVRSKNILLDGVTHIKGGHFVYLLNDCENITIANDTIKGTRDAIDLMGCRNVRVYNCNYTGCGDDTLGVKSDYALGRKILSENIYCWNCTFDTGCNGLQFGSETAGDFKNIKAWNITITRAGKAAIGITSNDGGVIDGVDFHDITVKNATNPIFINVTTRLRTGDPKKKVGTIKNVRIANVTMTAPKGPNASVISGRPDARLENITLENIKIVHPGGGTAEQARVTPPYLTTQYTPANMGTRPAYGFYIRHVKGLTMKNVELTHAGQEQRPAFVVFDLQDSVFNGVKAQKDAGVETLRLQQIKNLEIKNCPGITNEKITMADKAVK